MANEFSWSFPVAVSELPDDGKEFVLVADEAARAALAAHVGVLAAPALEARLRVAPDGRGGAVVEGTMQGAVTQNCVVTLEPFDNPVAEEIFARFAPLEAIAEETDRLIGLDEEDPPDPLVGGALDLADVVAEFLTLAVDPYPRKPGAVFAVPEDGKPAKESSPFAALEKLKSGRGDEKG